MSQDKKPELDSLLLSDDELVALARRDFENSAPASDELMEARVWKRLQRSTKPQKKYWWKGVGILAASVLLVFGVDRIVNKNTNQAPDTVKSGGENHSTTLILNDAGRLALHADDDSGVFALFQTNAGKPILWQGQVNEWPQDLEQPPRGTQVCLVRAEDARDLNRKMEILRSLPELPNDLACVEVP